MTSVSTLHLVMLRGIYLLIAVVMGSNVWPAILMKTGDWALAPSVVKAMMGSLTLLALFGLRHPLKMLPLLFWEIGWKTIWLAAVAFPAWRTGSMDARTVDLTFETGMVVIIYLAVPWRYVWEQYAKAPAELWKGSATK